MEKNKNRLISEPVFLKKIRVTMHKKTGMGDGISLAGCKYLKLSRKKLSSQGVVEKLEYSSLF